MNNSGSNRNSTLLQLCASPQSVRVGGQKLQLAPLRLRDWAALMGSEEPDLVQQLWLTLRPAHGDITRDDVAGLLEAERPGLERLLGSLQVECPADALARLPWRRIYNTLAAQYGWTFSQISELTLPQLAAALEISRPGVDRFPSAEAWRAEVQQRQQRRRDAMEKLAAWKEC